MLEFRLLGPFEVVRDGEVVSLGGMRRRTVLAMLVLDAGRVVPVGRLLEGVWGEEPPDTAVTALHGHVSHLRRALGDVLVTRSPGYLLDIDTDVVDVHRFEALVEQARVEMAAGNPEAARGRLDEALALRRGAPLADLADAPFALGVLPALEELEVSAREEQLEAELALGGADELIPRLKALVAEHPLRERLRGQLMLALYRAGRKPEALDSYAAARHALSEELGLVPGEPLQRLHDAILQDDPALGGQRRRMRAGAVPAARTRQLALLATAAAVAAAAVAVGVTIGGDDSPAPPALSGAGVLRIDPDKLEVVGVTPLDGTPASLTAAAGRISVVNADDQTITQIPAAGGRARTFATGGVPTDVAAAGADLWVAESRSEGTGGVVPRTIALAHVAGRMRTLRARIALPGKNGPASSLQQTLVAVTRSAVWAIAGSRVIQVDPLSDEVVRVLPYPALAVAAGAERVWMLTSDRTLISIDERGRTAGAPIDVAGSDAGSLAVGAGAVWISDPGSGELVRIDPGAPGRRHTVRLGAGIGELAYGHGSVWAVDAARGRILRLDASTGAVTGEVATGAIPRDVAVSGEDVWVSVAPRASSSRAVCGRTVDGGRPADVVMVADLPLRARQTRPIDEMVAAIDHVVTRHGHRAGDLRVAYRVCDDSTSQAGAFDEDKCVANARSYSADRRVVIEIGPYNSACARRQLPVAGAAPDGPLAMLSPTNTAPELTRDVRAGRRRAYARVIARDDRQGPAMAAVLRRRGDRDVFVLDDATGSATYGLELASYFARAARSAGLRVVGRASWPRGRSLTAVARRVERARPDAVYVSGQLEAGAGELVRALRRELPASITVAGPDLLLPLGGLFDAAGPAARGVLVSTSVLPVAAMPERAQALAAALARRLRVRRVDPLALYSAQATEVALDALARSDGSRSSVARALLATKLRDALLGPVEFTPHGDLRHAPVAVLRARRGHVPAVRLD